jgi:hypothetical protein
MPVPKESGSQPFASPGRKPDQSLDTFVWNGRIHGVIGASETSNSGGVAER